MELKDVITKAKVTIEESEQAFHAGFGEISDRQLFDLFVTLKEYYSGIKLQASENGEHPESRQRRENKLQSIRDIRKVIKDGNEKYVERLNILADLLTDLNATGNRLVELAIQIRDILLKKTKGTSE